MSTSELGVMDVCMYMESSYVKRISRQPTNQSPGVVVCSVKTAWVSQGPDLIRRIGEIAMLLEKI